MCQIDKKNTQLQQVSTMWQFFFNTTPKKPLYLSQATFFRSPKLQNFAKKIKSLLSTFEIGNGEEILWSIFVLTYERVFN
jgi:hypothetical protein